jgi:hypothetical protein
VLPPAGDRLPSPPDGPSREPAACAGADSSDPEPTEVPGRSSEASLLVTAAPPVVALRADPPAAPWESPPAAAATADAAAPDVPPPDVAAPAATGAEAAAPPAGTAPSPAPAFAAAVPGPLPAADPDWPSGGAEPVVNERDAESEPSRPEIRAMATPLASSTIKADATASHTCALLCLPSVNE